MEQHIWKQVGSVTEHSLFFGKQKTKMERRLLLGKRTLAFEKTKTKQIERCNPPRFKTYRRTKGSGNHVIPYFEGFTTAAICQDQSERSLFHETKTNGTLIATLHKLEGGPWHTQGRRIDDFGAETIIFMLGMERGQHGASRGHEGGRFADRYFISWNFAVR